MTSRRRAGRAAVLAGVALFAATQLALDVALDTARPGWRDPEYAVRLAQTLAAPADGRALVVVLGSSRVQMGLDPESLGLGPAGPRVQVVAGAGWRAAGCLVALRRLHAAGVRPAAVVVEILPAALADGRPVEAGVELRRLSLTDVSRLGPDLADPAGAWVGWGRGRVAPAHTFRADLLSGWNLGHLLPAEGRRDFLWKQTRPGGWMPYFHERIDDDARHRGLAAARAQYGAWLADFRVMPGPAGLLRRVAAEAQARGARVAFVVMPESPAFRAWYGPGGRRVLGEFCAGLAADTGAPVFDWTDSGSGEDDFADGHHLMRHAARALSAGAGAGAFGAWVRGGPADAVRGLPGGECPGGGRAK